MARYWEERVRKAWIDGKGLGAREVGIAAWVEYPLVNTLPGGEPVVPLIESSDAPLRGRIVVPVGALPRVALLVDMSQSAARSRHPFLIGEALARVSVLDAGLSAAREVLMGIDRSGFASRIGIVPFGEDTWPVVETDREGAMQTLAELSKHSTEAPGRTDLVCAMWTAQEWLEAGGGGHIVLLTDGDLPDSGRFTRCERAGGGHPTAVARCEALRNRTPCPSARAPEGTRSGSDIAELFRLVRVVQDRTQITPVLLGTQRPPRYLRELALHTGTRVHRIGREGQLSELVRSIVAESSPRSPAQRVLARNLRTGQVTQNLLGENGLDFSGQIGLAPGMNDLELLVEGEESVRGRFRFRVYAAEDAVETFREAAVATTEELTRQLRALEKKTRDQLAERHRSPAGGIEIFVEGGTTQPDRDPRVLAQ